MAGEDSVQFTSPSAAVRSLALAVLVACLFAAVVCGAIAWISLSGLASDGWRINGIGGVVALVFGVAAVLLFAGLLLALGLLLVRLRAANPTAVSAAAQGIQLSRGNESLVLPWDDVVGWRTMAVPGKVGLNAVVVRVGDPDRRERAYALMPLAQEGDEIVLGSLSGTGMERWTALAAAGRRRAES